jgi:hypothetical protein
MLRNHKKMITFMLEQKELQVKMIKIWITSNILWTNKAKKKKINRKADDFFQDKNYI